MDDHSEQHAQLLSLLAESKNSSFYYHPTSINELETIARKYRGILEYLQRVDEDIRRWTTFFNSELIDTEEKLSKSRHPKNKKRGEEYFGKAKRHLFDDIQALERLIAPKD